jgi:hypothetical protein
MSENTNTPEATTLADDAAEAAQTISTLSDYKTVRDAMMKDSADAQFGGDMLPFEAEPPHEEAEAEAVNAAPTDEPTEEAPAEGQEEQSANAQSKEPKKRRKTAKDRIDKVVWEREEARKEAALLRQELDAMKQGTPEAQPPQQPAQQPVGAPAPSADAEPKEKEYQEYGEFVAAKARWAARQEVMEAMKIAQSQQREAQNQAVYEDRAAAFAAKMQEGVASDPEFMAKVPSEILNLRPAMSLQQGEEPTGATAIADVLMDSDQPHILMEYLSSHEDDFRRISALHPMLAMREIGKLEVGLVAAPSGSAPAPVSSQAQPPIKPVGSSSAKPLVAHKSPEDINSVSEWRAARKQLLYKR